MSACSTALTTPPEHFCQCPPPQWFCPSLPAALPEHLCWQPPHWMCSPATLSLPCWSTFAYGTPDAHVKHSLPVAPLLPLLECFLPPVPLPPLPCFASMVPLPPLLEHLHPWPPTHPYRLLLPAVWEHPSPSSSGNTQPWWAKGQSCRPDPSHPGLE